MLNRSFLHCTYLTHENIVIQERNHEGCEEVQIKSLITSTSLRPLHNFLFLEPFSNINLR
jgi:hypothetical protein